MVASKHRPTRAIIDLDAIRSNIQTISQSLLSGVKTFAVVKANAYGHGAKEVARTVSDLVDAFCVSNIDEALELRQSGVEHPILILGVVPTNAVSLAIEHCLTLTVASMDWTKELVALYDDLSGLQVHIKVDSGMGRIGMSSSQEINDVMSILRSKAVVVEGIFTHFATADEVDQGHYQKQLQTFKELLTELNNCPPLVHASNSATTLWHEDGIFKAVRLGIAMYGLNPSGQVLNLPYDLRPALSLETKICHLKTLHQGDTVGYGATYQVEDEEIIATIPIGYADGWLRRMQGFSVLVDGNYCPIVGRVSMDQTTIALPKIYPLGTSVTLIGSNGGQRILATDVAEYSETINYEILCLLSERVPRIYKGERRWT